MHQLSSLHFMLKIDFTPKKIFSVGNIKKLSCALIIFITYDSVDKNITRRSPT